MAEAKRVMISSTGRDLEDYRRAAIEVCNQLALTPIAMEFFEAMGQGATEGSKRKLREADVYVGIFAHRYGYVEGGYDRGVTEVEFDYAAELGLERLCFIADPSHPWPPEAIDPNRERIEEFKQRLDKAVIRATFTTVDDYRAKLLHALIEWRQRSGAREPNAEIRLGAARCLEHLYKIRLARDRNDAEMLNSEVWYLAEDLDDYAEAIAAVESSPERELQRELLDRIRPVAAHNFEGLDRVVDDLVAATS